MKKVKVAMKFQNPYVTDVRRTRAGAKHGTLALSRLVEAGVEEWKGREGLT